MNKLALIVLLAIGTNALGQSKGRIATSPTDFVPARHVVFEKIKGDLNGDKQADYVFIIKGTDKDLFVKHEHRGVLDRNRRGIIVALSSQNGYELALENRDCFSSENEDGGVYFAPELGVFIEKGNLLIHYFGGRYGFQSYKFRYQNSDFELIGYESSEDSGPTKNRTVSVNLVTKKARVRKYIASGTGEDEKFKESWKSFSLSAPIKLSAIDDLDGVELEKLLGLSR